MEDFYSDPRVMTYDDLVKANAEAIKLDYNRTLILENFFKTVKEFGYDPKTTLYPALPLTIHEHAQGKKVDPHVRLKIVGPLCPNDTLVVEAMLDCPMHIYQKLSVYDVDNQKLHAVN